MSGLVTHITSEIQVHLSNKEFSLGSRAWRFTDKGWPVLSSEPPPPNKQTASHHLLCGWCARVCYSCIALNNYRRRSRYLAISSQSHNLKLIIVGTPQSSGPLSTRSLVFIPPSSIILIQLEPSKCNCPSAVAMSSTILINFLNFISRDLLLLLSSGVPGTGWWCCDLTASGDLRCPVSTVAQLRRTLVTVFSASTSTSYKSWTRSILSTMAHLLEHNVFFCPCTHKPLQTYAFT